MMRTFDILRMHHSGVEVDDGCVIVSLRVMGEGCKWLTLVDDNGTPKFYSSQEDIFALRKKGEVRSWLKNIETYRIDEFEGLKLGEYNDVFFSIYNDIENPVCKLIRYMIDLIFAKDGEEITDLMHLPMGKSIDEVDVPIIYVEDNYLMENGEKHN
jgi:hypothetical protein